jgi:hypothetical protein
MSSSLPLAGGDMLPPSACSASPPPILAFPHTGGRDLYLSLSARQGGRSAGTVRQSRAEQYGGGPGWG